MKNNALKNEDGSALLVVMIFIFVMISITMSCAKGITVLQKELRLIEKKHDARFNAGNTAP